MTMTDVEQPAPVFVLTPEQVTQALLVMKSEIADLYDYMQKICTVMSAQLAAYPLPDKAKTTEPEPEPKAYPGMYL